MPLYNTGYDELYHYGVKGMKWGKHIKAKDNKQTVNPNSKTYRGTPMYDSKGNSTTKRTGTLNIGNGTSKIDRGTPVYDNRGQLSWQIRAQGGTIKNREPAVAKNSSKPDDNRTNPHGLTKTSGSIKQPTKHGIKRGSKKGSSSKIANQSVKKLKIPKEKRVKKIVSKILGRKGTTLKNVSRKA